MNAIKHRTALYHPNDFVGVASPTAIYIGVADKAEFDRIAMPETDHRPRGGNLLTKKIEQDGCAVYFQHWFNA